MLWRYGRWKFHLGRCTIWSISHANFDANGNKTSIQLRPCADSSLQLLGVLTYVVNKDLSSDSRPLIHRGTSTWQRITLSGCYFAFPHASSLVLLRMNIVRLHILIIRLRLLICSFEWWVGASLHTSFDLPQPPWTLSKHGRHRQQTRWWEQQWFWLSTGRNLWAPHWSQRIILSSSDSGSCCATFVLFWWLRIFFIQVTMLGFVCFMCPGKRYFSHSESHVLPLTFTTPRSFQCFERAWCWRAGWLSN